MRCTPTGLAGCNVPQPQGLILASGDQVRRIRTEAQRGDFLLVSCESRQNAAGVDRPDLYCSIFASGCEQRTAFAKHNLDPAFGMSAEK